jgi:hypothetical protein
MQSLLQVQSFADRWHRGTWRSRDLPDAIGATVVWEQGGEHILGFAMTLPSGAEINLNSRIRGTPLERPVILHESTHIIQGDVLGFCGNAWIERQGEQNAVYGSSLLAIPTEAAAMFAQRRATVHELADYYEVPRALVYMRGALAVLLEEAEGEREKARQQLAAARRSLESWMAWTARQLRA